MSNFWKTPMISQTAEYCLRAVICLAGTHGQPRTTHQIAATTKIPLGYLSKVLGALGRAKLVTAQRGFNGGFLLQRAPASLTLLDVVRVADPSRRVRTCPLGIHGPNLCALHRQLDDHAARTESSLEGYTVAQLLAEPGVPPLCAAARDTNSLNDSPGSHSGDSRCSTCATRKEKPGSPTPALAASAWPRPTANLT